MSTSILTLPGRSADLGDGLMVNRVLPTRGRRLVGPWCFLDSFGPMSFTGRKAMDVAPHPHIGLQTVSWLFAGEVLHNDSLGMSGLARPGTLNLMTAGRGIAHSEETPPRHSGALHGLQLWLALPGAERQCEPAFDHYNNLPILEPGGGRVYVFMGRLADAQSPGRAFSPLVGAELQLCANTRMPLPLETAWEHALMVIDGDLELEGRPFASSALHDLGHGRDGIELRSYRGARAVLIGGAPFGEDIVMWWNFVARTADEIRVARDDWQAGLRFGAVKAYRGERLSAPELTGQPHASR